ncbi:MAG: tRNA lysidine(34) synthetase TilS [Aquabacterium sp.]
MTADLTQMQRVAVAFSGGRDSTALLYATARMARDLGGIEVVALHVHHGLSAQADAWLAHIEAQCARWASDGLPLKLKWHRLRIVKAAGDSAEALARRARYAALAEMANEAGCGAILLAHHRRDQAETFLLQALRGSGVAGLAAMPANAVRRGVRWLRPWLDRPREAIEAYVHAHGLSYVDDDSNADVRHARNRLRLAVWPALSSSFPQAEMVLAQAAARQADVLACLEAWLATALPGVMRQGPDGESGLDVAAWRAHPPALQRELLRAWFRRATGQGLPAAWVMRLQSEVDHGAPPQHWPLALMRDGRTVCSGRVGCYRGVLGWHTAPEVSVDAKLVSRQTGEVRVWHALVRHVGAWPLPCGQGRLLVSWAPAGECGVLFERLAGAQWRQRAGGEQFQMALNRPARSLKKQFQMMSVPAWRRDAPLLWVDDQLVFVPGLGTDARARESTPGPGQVVLAWAP